MKNRRTQTQAPRRTTTGFTLLELLVTLSVLGVLLTVALPSMRTMLERNHLKAAAQSVAEDLQWTRSESIRRNQGLMMIFDTDSDSWCYGIEESARGTCDCQLAKGENGACDLKSVMGADYPSVALEPTFEATGFEPRRATAINGSITLTADGGAQVRVILSRLGRIRICSPEASVPDYEACGG